MLVTHDPDVAEACDRVVRMRDGRVGEDTRNHGESERDAGPTGAMPAPIVEPEAILAR